MKSYLYLAARSVRIVLLAGLLSHLRAQHDNSHEKNAFTPDTIPWGPPPPLVRPGAQFAVLEGDPSASLATSPSA